MGFACSVIPGWSEGPDLESRDSGFASARRAGTTSNQILLRDDFAQPGIVVDEFLDEFMHAVLEDIVHVRMLQPVADAAGVALGGTLAAIGDADLVEVAHEVAVAAGERTRQ